MTTTSPVQTPPAAVVALADQLRARRRTTARRRRLVDATLALVVLAASTVALMFGGSSRIDLAELPAAMIGRAGGLADYVIFENRLPRALVAVLAGSLFAASGVLYQRLIRNPLATPDVIGVSAGASAGAVGVMAAGGGGPAVQGGAMLGALVATGVIFVLAGGSNRGTYRLVLVGIGIAACFAAVTNYLLASADLMFSERATRWLVGSLSGSTWADVRWLLGATVVGVAAAGLLRRHLDALRLGDRTAAGLGTPVGTARALVLLVGALIAAVATSVTGPVAFVALVCGPLAVRLVPAASVVTAAMLGGALLAVSDLIAQTAPVISPVPTGTITALAGAPVLMFLLVKTGRRS